MLTTYRAAVLLALASSCLAQSPFSGFGGSNGNPYSSSGNGDGGDSGDGSGSDASGFSQLGFTSFSEYQTMVTAHAVLACVAFAFLFPVGGIMIRLASFPGLWWVHGLFQVVAFVLYIVAFAIGIHLATNLRAWNQAHPIIGVVLLILLIFQPFLGLLHHTMFKKYKRRVVWSYGHIWLGRIVITLGIVNGGLGLQLAQTFPAMRPTQGDIIAYAAGAGVMWMLYVLSIFIGERRRDRLAARRIDSPKGEKRRAKSSSSRNSRTSRKSRTGSRYA